MVIFQTISFFFFKYNSLFSLFGFFWFNSIFYYPCVLSLKRRLVVKCLTYNYQKKKDGNIWFIALRLALKTVPRVCIVRCIIYTSLSKLYINLAITNISSLKLYYVPKSCCIRNSWVLLSIKILIPRYIIQASLVKQGAL